MTSNIILLGICALAVLLILLFSGFVVFVYIPRKVTRSVLENVMPKFDEKLIIEEERVKALNKLYGLMKKDFIHLESNLDKEDPLPDIEDEDYDESTE